MDTRGPSRRHLQKMGHQRHSNITGRNFSIFPFSDQLKCVSIRWTSLKAFHSSARKIYFQSGMEVCNEGELTTWRRFGLRPCHNRGGNLYEAIFRFTHEHGTDILWINKFIFKRIFLYTIEGVQSESNKKGYSHGIERAKRMLWEKYCDFYSRPFVKYFLPFSPLENFLPE